MTHRRKKNKKIRGKEFLRENKGGAGGYDEMKEKKNASQKFCSCARFLFSSCDLAHRLSLSLSLYIYIYIYIYHIYITWAFERTLQKITNGRNPLSLKQDECGTREKTETKKPALKSNQRRE